MQYRLSVVKAAIIFCAATVANVSADEKENKTEFSPHGYAGIGGMIWLYADEYTEGMANGGGFHSRLGYQFSDNFAIEVRASGGGEGSIDGVNVSLKSAVTGLLVYSAKTSSRLRAGAYAGYTRAVLEAGIYGWSSYGGSRYYSVESRESGLAFGGLLESDLSNGLSLYADYGTYIMGSDFILQEVSVGLVKRY